MIVFTRFTLLSFACTLVLLSSCARDIKGTGHAGTGGDTGTYDSESLDFADVAPRPDGMSPTDANYSALQDYIVYFPYDSYSIGSTERPKLEAIASYLNTNPDSRLILAGHTDERGTTQYNLSLGERRALATRDYLVGLGVSSNRLTTMSYGEEKPAIDSAADVSYAQNRRSEFGIY